MTRKDIIRVISEALGLACIPHDLQVHWCCGDTAGDDPVVGALPAAVKNSCPMVRRRWFKGMVGLVNGRAFGPHSRGQKLLRHWSVAETCGGCNLEYRMKVRSHQPRASLSTFPGNRRDNAGSVTDDAAHLKEKAMRSERSSPSSGEVGGYSRRSFLSGALSALRRQARCSGLPPH